MLCTFSGTEGSNPSLYAIEKQGIIRCPAFSITVQRRVRDLKASVPRFKPREEPKVKMIRGIIFNESADQTFLLPDVIMR